MGKLSIRSERDLCRSGCEAVSVSEIVDPLKEKCDPKQENSVPAKEKMKIVPI